MEISGKDREMKVTYRTIYFLALSAVLLMTQAEALSAEPKPKQSEDTWSSEKPAAGVRMFKLTDKAIERIMNRLKETDPKKAEELEKLQKQDSEAFKTEIRKLMRRHRRERLRNRRLQGSDVRLRKGRGAGAGPQGPGMAGGPHPEHARYLKWLRENYPQKAEELYRLKKDNPELFQRRMRRDMRRHQRIISAAEQCPELAEAMKKSMELKDKRNELLEKIKSATGEDEKKQLTAQLEDVVGKRYDLIVKRKEIRYELLQKKIEKMQQQVKENAVELEKWKDPAVKQQNVKKRVAELIGRAESFKWD